MTAKLEFIVGRAGTGKTRFCLESIRATLEKDPLGKPVLLLVPEYMTYKMERKLAEALQGNGQGFMGAWVFGFCRFARQVLLETGGADLTRISDVGRQLILRKILLKHQQAGDLTVYAHSARQRGFIDSLSGIIKELKSYRLSTELLRQTAADFGQGRLSGKLTEIALLADDFQREMAGRANDSEDLMTLLAAKIPQASSFQGAEVWVDGFTFFNPQELEVMAALLQTAASVHVTLPLAGEALGGRAKLQLPENQLETGLFRRPYHTYELLVGLWQQLGGSRPRVRLLREEKRARVPALAFLEQQLFAPGEQQSSEGEGLRLVEAANRRLEVEALAADILRLTRGGWRYRDIGVLVREGEAYDGLLQLVLQEYGIPYFYDGKRPSVHHPLAELLRSALETIRLGWRYEAVFRCLRTGFFPCVRDDVDKLENYVLEFGIRGKGRWTQKENWSWYRRYSLEEEEEPEEKEQERLLALDGLRRLTARPLEALNLAFEKARNVREMTGSLYDFLIDLQVPQRLQEWTELAEAQGRLADAGEHKQIWDSCMELFDQLVEISGTEEMSLKDYEAVLGAGLDALKISLIPPGLDYVTLSSFDQNSLDDTPAIYILGANAGSMPKGSHEQGLLTDADRLHIDEAFEKQARAGGRRHEISKGGQERSFGERFLLYRGFTEASKYLWVSYALADSDGTGLQPAGLAHRLRLLFPGADFLSIPLETVAREDELLLSAPGPALSGLASALRGQKEQGSMQSFWQDVYNWLREQEDFARAMRMALAGLFAKAKSEFLPPELARHLFLSGGRLRGSVTQFELFRKCPFAHFASYGLKLQERREYRFRSLDLGQLLHAVLRGYGAVVQKDYENKWETVPEEQRKALCHKLIEEMSPRLQSEVLLSRDNYKHLKSRLQATAERAVAHLTAWAALSKFRPAFFEEHFGGAGDKVRLKPLPLKGGFSLSFKGQIDRLDVHTDAPYYLVIDYKTGQAALNVFEVYYGLRLQLLAYLLVGQQLLAQQGEQLLPAGMLYAFLQNPLISGSRARLEEEELQKKVRMKLRMPGWVLADPKIIASLEEGAGGEYILAKVKEDKKGEAAFAPPDCVKTPEEFQLLLAYVEYILQDTGDRILAGDIAISPYRLKGSRQETACTYCKFGDVCGFDPNLPGCSYRDLQKEEAAALEEKMAVLTGREDLKDAIH